ncbi:MAG: hypothetical protein EXR28_13610 [Betaproteobacteria bacterium]|nr:hypothetical protein [Betaproteobacteria bacterium]
MPSACKVSSARAASAHAVDVRHGGQREQAEALGIKRDKIRQVVVAAPGQVARLEIVAKMRARNTQRQHARPDVLPLTVFDGFLPGPLRRANDSAYRSQGLFIGRVHGVVMNVYPASFSGHGNPLVEQFLLFRPLSSCRLRQLPDINVE